MIRVGRAPRARSIRVLAALPRVYGSALAAAVDDRAAQEVTARVIERAARLPAAREHELAGQAILAAMRSAPAPPFDAMAPVDREAVALARLGRCSVDEIAEQLAISPAEVKRRLRSGLAALAEPAQALAS